MAAKRERRSVRGFVVVCSVSFGCLFNTVEPRFDEPLYNEVLGITNDILLLQPGQVYGKIY